MFFSSFSVLPKDLLTHGIQSIALCNATGPSKFGVSSHHECPGIQSLLLNMPLFKSHHLPPPKSELSQASDSEFARRCNDELRYNGRDTRLHDDRMFVKLLFHLLSRANKCSLPPLDCSLDFFQDAPYQETSVNTQFHVQHLALSSFRRRSLFGLCEIVGIYVDFLQQRVCGDHGSDLAKIPSTSPPFLCTSQHQADVEVQGEKRSGREL